MSLIKGLSLILITIVSFSVSAQNYSHEFGVLTDYEKEMTVYEKDTTAEAVVIYDSGVSEFFETENNFKLSFQRQTKIKVLKESYINDAEFYKYLYKGADDKEKIKEIKAFTYNFKDGQIIKTELKEEHIYTENINKHWDKVKFAMPDVQVGSIIEIKYEVTSPYKFNLNDWIFQDEIPTIFSEYRVKMIPFYEYRLRLQGADKFDSISQYEEKGFEKHFHEIQYRDKVYHFMMNDIPAFKTEPYAGSLKDYIIKLDFQLSKFHPYSGPDVDVLSTWENVIKELTIDSEFGVFVKKSKNKFKNTADENKLDEKTQIEKINFVLNHIKQNYSWNGLHRKHSGKTLNTFLKEKSGSNAEINLYMVGALQALDIEAYPVIISTRDNGKIIRDYPFTEPFNYVLAYAKIDNNWNLLDATDIFCPNDKIPEDCINDIGLVINKDEIKWIKVVRQEVSIIQNSVQSQVSSDLDSLIGSFTVSSNGYSAMKLRKQFKNKSEDIEEYIRSDNYEITSPVTTENYDDVDKDYIMKYDIACLSDRIQNKTLIHPFFHDPMQDNPFKEQSRKYPIDMVYPKSTTYTNEIKLPDNCMVEKLPDNFFFNNDLFLLQYAASESNGVIHVRAAYQFKKSIYEPEEYSEIKAYYDMIIKQFNQKIVLIEKTE